MNRTELADFLRSRRARIQPSDVGLPIGRRRRTPGLRREEVAHLAAMSVDYYARLEQARGPCPSRQMIDALARALRLSDAERAYIIDLAGDAQPRSSGPPRDVPSGVLHLLDRLGDTPAFVTDAKWDVLAWNAMASALMTDFRALPERDRNAMRWLFGPSAPDPSDPATQCLAQEAVADLRAAAARYPDDDGVRQLVKDLRASSVWFATLWVAHDVRVRRTNRKRIEHPVVGWLEVDIETLLVPERDQRVVMYTTTPGTPSHEALQLLRVVGLQEFADR